MMRFRQRPSNRRYPAWPYSENSSDSGSPDSASISRSISRNGAPSSCYSRRPKVDLPTPPLLLGTYFSFQAAQKIGHAVARNLLQETAHGLLLQLLGFYFQELADGYVQHQREPPQEHDRDVSFTGFQLAEVAPRHVGLIRERAARQASFLTQLTHPTADFFQKVGLRCRRDRGDRL